jgi:hypothetical protein
MACILCGWPTSLRPEWGLVDPFDGTTIMRLGPKHCRCNRDELTRKSSYPVAC